MLERNERMPVRGLILVSDPPVCYNADALRGNTALSTSLTLPVIHHADVCSFVVPVLDLLPAVSRVLHQQCQQLQSWQQVSNAF